ncbi:MAG: signal peptidase I [Solirubrobacteraceae bacterium]
MKPRRLNSALVVGAVALVAWAAWTYVVPTALGGETTYVITEGTSMEPSFHTGDLAIVRPAGRYAVGDVVAYRSSLLHIIVLHRIVAIHGDRYVFKGDHNDFLDPVQPTRAEIVGKLWIHIPHAGFVLAWLHTPLAVAILIAAAGLLVVSSEGERRRRGRRRRNASEPRARGARAMKPAKSSAAYVDVPGPLAAAVALMVVFAILAGLAFSRPTTRSTTHTSRYTQSVTFSYRSLVRPGPVYPNGIVSTGDPLFLQLVKNLRIGIRYQMTSAASHVIAGTRGVTVVLSEPTGWSSHFQVFKVAGFRGDAFTERFTIYLDNIQSLLDQVDRLSGVTGSEATIAVDVSVRIRGLVAGRPIAAVFRPSLSFALQPLQLQPNPAGGPPDEYTTVQRGLVTVASSAPNTINLLGVKVGVRGLRIASVVGFVLAAIAVLLFVLRARRARPVTDEDRIQAQYGHLIVAVRAPGSVSSQVIEVTSIEALVKLAENSGQLVLHQHNGGGDSYLVNDGATAYRYMPGSPNGAAAQPPARAGQGAARNGLTNQPLASSASPGAMVQSQVPNLEGAPAPSSAPVSPDVPVAPATEANGVFVAGLPDVAPAPASQPAATADVAAPEASPAAADVAVPEASPAAATADVAAPEASPATATADVAAPEASPAAADVAAPDASPAPATADVAAPDASPAAATPAASVPARSTAPAGSAVPATSEFAAPSYPDPVPGEAAPPAVVAAAASAAAAAAALMRRPVAPDASAVSTGASPTASSAQPSATLQPGSPQAVSPSATLQPGSPQAVPPVLEQRSPAAPPTGPTARPPSGLGQAAASLPPPSSGPGVTSDTGGGLGSAPTSLPSRPPASGAGPGIGSGLGPAPTSLPPSQAPPPAAPPSEPQALLGPGPTSLRPPPTAPPAAPSSEPQAGLGPAPTSLRPPRTAPPAAPPSEPQAGLGPAPTSLRPPRTAPPAAPPAAPPSGSQALHGPAPTSLRPPWAHPTPGRERTPTDAPRQPGPEHSPSATVQSATQAIQAWRARMRKRLR